MKKWEYLSPNTKGTTVNLNELGKDGWELVTVTAERDGYHTCYFKREIPGATPSPMTDKEIIDDPRR